MNLKVSNGIVNGDFKTLQEGELFPEGWIPFGGNASTMWEMERGISPALVIEQSSGRHSGLLQSAETHFPTKSQESWKFETKIQAASSDVTGYLRIYPVTLEGNIKKPWESRFPLDTKAETYRHWVTTPSEAHSFRIEVGLLGAGRLRIFEVKAFRLFAPRSVTLNIKEALKHLHIESIGEIQKPVRFVWPNSVQTLSQRQNMVQPDVRSLNPNRDALRIYGSEDLPLATSKKGRAQVEIHGHGFQESIEAVNASQNRGVTTIRDVSALQKFSYAILNEGNALAKVRLEISPDGRHWAIDNAEQTVEQGQVWICTPRHFLRFARISFVAEGITPLRIWIQAQS